MDCPNSATPAAGALPIATIYKSFVCAAIVLGLFMVAGIWHLGANAMIACGFLGAAFIHAASKPGPRQILAAVGAGLAFGGGYLLLQGPVGTDAFTKVMAVGAFLGVGSIATLAFEIVIYERGDRSRFLSDALVLPVFSLVAGISMQLTNGSSHPSYDYLLYAFDSSLGISPNRAVIGWYQRFHWIGTTASLVYASLLIFPPLYHAWAILKGRAQKNNLMHLFVIAGLSGFVFYQVCPAMGPIYAFGSNFPDHLPQSVSLGPFSSTGVNNAMPSMHMTWAILVWWAAWELGPLAVTVATLMAGFTALATLGSGEHYLIDLIVAVPMVLGVRGIYFKNLFQAILGLGLVAVWTLFLRVAGWTHFPPALNWSLIAATIALTVVAMFRPKFAAAASPKQNHRTRAVDCRPDPRP